MVGRKGGGVSILFPNNLEMKILEYKKLEEGAVEKNSDFTLDALNVVQKFTKYQWKARMWIMFMAATYIVRDISGIYCAPTVLREMGGAQQQIIGVQSQLKWWFKAEILFLVYHQVVIQHY